MVRPPGGEHQTARNRRLKNRLASVRGRYAANAVVRWLRSVFARAASLGVIGVENPASAVKLLKVASDRRSLKPAEMERLWAALEQEPVWTWRLFFPLQAALAMRWGELRRLRWRDIDFDLAGMVLGHTKNGDPLIQPIPAALLEQLRNAPSRGKSEWVFPSFSRNGEEQPVGGVNAAWRRIAKRAGLVDEAGKLLVTPHSLRHTAATWMKANGVPTGTVKDALNHRSIQSTIIYEHADVTAVRSALDDLSSRLFPMGVPSVVPKIADADTKTV